MPAVQDVGHAPPRRRRARSRPKPAPAPNFPVKVPPRPGASTHARPIVRPRIKAQPGPYTAAERKQVEKFKRSPTYTSAIKQSYKSRPLAERQERVSEIANKLSGPRRVSARNLSRLSTEDRAVLDTTLRRQRRDEELLKGSTYTDRARKLTEAYKRTAPYKHALLEAKFPVTDPRYKELFSTNERLLKARGFHRGIDDHELMNIPVAGLGLVAAHELSKDVSEVARSWKHQLSTSGREAPEPKPKPKPKPKRRRKPSTKDVVQRQVNEAASALPVLGLGLKVAPVIGKDVRELATTWPASTLHAALEAYHDPSHIPKLVMDPYKELAKHPVETATKHPVQTALMVAPVPRVPLRIAGRVSRGVKVGDRQLIKPRVSLRRPDLTLPGTAFVEHQHGSHSLFGRHLQTRRDRRPPKPAAAQHPLGKRPLSVPEGFKPTPRETHTVYTGPEGRWGPPGTLARRSDEFADWARQHTSRVVREAEQETAKQVKKTDMTWRERRDAIAEAGDAARVQASVEVREAEARMFGGNERPEVGKAQVDIAASLRESAKTGKEAAQDELKSARTGRKQARREAALARGNVRTSPERERLEQEHVQLQRDEAAVQRAGRAAYTRAVSEARRGERGTVSSEPLTALKIDQSRLARQLETSRGKHQDAVAGFARAKERAAVMSQKAGGPEAGRLARAKTVPAGTTQYLRGGKGVEKAAEKLQAAHAEMTGIRDSLKDVQRQITVHVREGRREARAAGDVVLRTAREGERGLRDIELPKVKPARRIADELRIVKTDSGRYQVHGPVVGGRYGGYAHQRPDANVARTKTFKNRDAAQRELKKIAAQIAEDTTHSARVLELAAKVREPEGAKRATVARPVSAKEFDPPFREALNGERGAWLSDYPVKERATHTTLLHPDGRAGAAVKPDGDIVSVFRLPDGQKGAGRQMLRDAIEHGGTKLDAIGDELRDLYEAEGFKVTGKVAWDDQYAPKGWNYARDGRPDIYFMEYAGQRGSRPAGPAGAASHAGAAERATDARAGGQLEGDQPGVPGTDVPGLGRAAGSPGDRGAGAPPRTVNLRAAREATHAKRREVTAETTRLRNTIPDKQLQALREADQRVTLAADAHARARGLHKALEQGHKDIKQTRAQGNLVDAEDVGRLFHDRVDAQKIVGRYPDMEVMRVGDRWAAVPTVARKRLQHQLTVGTDKALGALGLRTLNRFFRPAVLALSGPWLLGQFGEAGLRLAVAHGFNPLSIGASIVREHKVYKGLEGAEAGAGEAFREAVSRGGAFGVGSAMREYAENTRTLAKDFEDTNLESVAGELTKFGRKRAPSEVRGTWRMWQHGVFEVVNGLMEQGVRRGLAGRAIKQGPLMEQRLLGLSDKAIKEAYQGLRETPAQLQLARAVTSKYGKYHGFGPYMREFMAHWTPFLPWTLNMLNFLGHVIPRDHPIFASLVASQEQAQEEWRKAHRISFYGDDHVPLWMMGMYPTSDGKFRQLSRYVPAAPGDFLQQGARLALPQLSGLGLPLVTGRDFRDQELKTDTAMLTESALEGAQALIPGASLALAGSGLDEKLRAKSRGEPPPEPKRKTVGGRLGYRLNPFKKVRGSSRGTGSDGGLGGGGLDGGGLGGGGL